MCFISQSWAVWWELVYYILSFTIFGQIKCIDKYGEGWQSGNVVAAKVIGWPAYS